MPAFIEVINVGVPQISLRDFSHRREEIKAQLLTAASQVGFFTLVDHPIPLENVDKAFALAERFFDLPDEVKMKTAWNGKNMGYEKVRLFLSFLPAVGLTQFSHPERPDPPLDGLPRPEGVASNGPPADGGSGKVLACRG